MCNMRDLRFPGEMIFWRNSVSHITGLRKKIPSDCVRMSSEFSQEIHIYQQKVRAAVRIS